MATLRKPDPVLHRRHAVGHETPLDNDLMLIRAITQGIPERLRLAWLAVKMPHTYARDIPSDQMVDRSTMLEYLIWSARHELGELKREQTTPESRQRRRELESFLEEVKA